MITPLYLLARGASAAEVGLLVTVWAAGAAVLGLAAGFAGDRFGRKSVLVAFSACTAVCALAFYFNLPFWALGIAGALGTIGRGGGPASGGAFGPFYSAEQALLAEHTRARIRTRIFALFSMVGAFGGAIGFLLTYERDYGIDFLITVAIGVLLILSILPISETRDPSAPPAERAAPAPISRATWRILVRFMVTNVTNGLAVGFLGPMLVLWFHLRYHAGAAEIGTLYMVIGIAAIGSYAFVGRIVSAIGGAVRTIVGLRIVSCVLLAVLPLMPTLWIAGLVYLVRMLFNSVTLPVRQSYVMGIIPPAERARASSLSNLPSQFAMMAGPSIAGVMLHSIWIGFMLETAATLQLLNAALYWRFFHRIHPPEERDASS